jgi:macrolide transport system ATP-binding/permease protein
LLSPLIARDLVKSYRARPVLDGIELLAAPGRRVGCIGENGAGKSTLLRLLAGVEAPDSGTVEAPCDLGYLAQEPEFPPGCSVREAMADALAPLHRAVAEVERLSARLASDPAVWSEYAHALEWAQSHDAWDADRRALLATDRLGLAGVAGARQVRTLSGGQRSRLAMALLMTSRPECVLLDEPTNHLDDDALTMLEDFLLSLPGVVVVVSHDRVFLDRVCTDIVDLDRSDAGTGVRYGGNFSDYLVQKAAARQRWVQTYAEQQDEITRLRRASKQDTGSIAHDRGPTDNDKFIYKFKGGNVERSQARRVRNAQRRLAVAEREQVRKPRPPLHFDAVLTGAGSAVSVRELVVPGRISLDTLDVPAGGRLLITGANGSGKSSLLAVLAGQLPPVRGVVHVGGRVGLLAQEVSFADGGLSAQRTFELHAPGHQLSELGLLPKRELATAVDELSVGQRRRLALAILIAKAPNLLLLDEPTNHISLRLAGELEQALGRAPGTVLVASHDRWLRGRWTEPVLALAESVRATSGAGPR